MLGSQNYVTLPQDVNPLSDDEALLFCNTETSLHKKNHGLWNISWSGFVYFPQPPWVALSKDGMDQSKWAVPRVRHGRLTKRIAKHDRPRTKLQGCWLHGIVLCMFVLDVRQGGDGSMVCECFSRALDKMKEACDHKGKPYPKRIILWELWRCI